MKNGLLKMLFERLSFSEAEKQSLTKTNTLRNKLIHCEPDAIARLLQELDPAFRPPNAVQQIPLGPKQSGDEILDSLFRRKGAVPVRETNSVQDGFAGWMMQAAIDGTFARTQHLLVEATKLIIVKGNTTA